MEIYLRSARSAANRSPILSIRRARARALALLVEVLHASELPPFLPQYSHKYTLSLLQRRTQAFCNVLQALENRMPLHLRLIPQSASGSAP